MIHKDKLYEILKRCWSIKTSSKWERRNPAKGQCSVTALLIHDLFGGKILKTRVNSQWHFYNRVKDQIVDLTSQQFSEPICYEHIESSAEEARKDTTLKQYELLKGQFARISAELENTK